MRLKARWVQLGLVGALSLLHSQGHWLDLAQADEPIMPQFAEETNPLPVTNPSNGTPPSTATVKLPTPFPARNVVQPPATFAPGSPITLRIMPRKKSAPAVQNPAAAELPSIAAIRSASTAAIRSRESGTAASTDPQIGAVGSSAPVPMTSTSAPTIAAPQPAVASTPAPTVASTPAPTVAAPSDLPTSPSGTNVAFAPDLAELAKGDAKPVEIPGTKVPAVDSRSKDYSSNRLLDLPRLAAKAVPANPVAPSRGPQLLPPAAGALTVPDSPAAVVPAPSTVTPEAVANPAPAVTEKVTEKTGPELPAGESKANPESPAEPLPTIPAPTTSVPTGPLDVVSPKTFAPAAPLTAVTSPSPVVNPAPAPSAARTSPLPSNNSPSVEKAPARLPEDPNSRPIIIVPINPLKKTSTPAAKTAAVPNVPAPAASPSDTPASPVARPAQDKPVTEAPKSVTESQPAASTVAEPKSAESKPTDSKSTEGSPAAAKPPEPKAPVAPTPAPEKSTPAVPAPTPAKESTPAVQPPGAPSQPSKPIPQPVKSDSSSDQPAKVTPAPAQPAPTQPASKPADGKAPEAKPADPKAVPSETKPATPETKATTPQTKPSVTETKPAEPESKPEEPRDPLLTLVDQAIEITSRRRLQAGVNSPWQIVHGIVAQRWDTRIIMEDGQREMSAIEYLMSGPQFEGQPLWEKTVWGGRGHPFTRPYAFEGHPTQFLGYMTMANIPLEYEVRTPQGPVTIRDIIHDAKMQVRQGPEITWTLWALIHYEAADSQWINNANEPWSIERLVKLQVDEPVTAGACGGCHGLFALCYSRNIYFSEGRQLRGAWLEADQKVKGYVEATRQMQNGDGSFSSEFYKGPGLSHDSRTRINASGHQLEWVLVALPQSRLKETWVRRAVESVARDLIANSHNRSDCGPMYHAMHSLILYRQRLDPKYRIPKRNSPLKLAERGQPQPITPGSVIIPIAPEQPQAAADTSSESGGRQPQRSGLRFGGGLFRR